MSFIACGLLRPIIRFACHQNYMYSLIYSSVAAGHDNCHYDCYESQLERTLQGVFEAAGMKLIVQNAGEVSTWHWFTSLSQHCNDSHQDALHFNREEAVETLTKTKSFA